MTRAPRQQKGRVRLALSLSLSLTRRDPSVYEVFCL